MGGDGLSVFDSATVFEVGGDAGGTEGVAADSVGEADWSTAAFDHTEDVATGHAVEGQLAGLSAGAAEEGGEPLVGEAARFEVGVQIGLGVVVGID